ncbi:helix-turn-helix transcriptional regulator [Mobiluncus mulieris]|uniref:Helix-turn-helix transcriptional regulator n=1 Tax=Mobiluncus mulieris TaxID=2052 RepID=A0A7Y0Y429_9ACTO|nr:helix-turn-helix transcriptional regulator [Mobiluncus mulieris]NMW64622.1 helix-turn-helix transcriptional regulator [Mobiluncus mulieris]
MELNLSTREIVASNVRAEMARRNRQFGELAEILGVSRPTLRRSMAGKRDFTVTEMEEIARWLNMPLMNLMNTSRAETQSPTTDRSAA